MELEQPETQIREELFIHLYEDVFPDVAVFIRRMGGNLEDTKDIFQDALLIYYEKTTQPEFFVQQDEKAYLIGICKHLWYKKYRKDEQLAQPNSPVDFMLNEETKPRVSQRIFSLVAKSGKKCLELLQSFYFEKRNMKEIAALFGFSGERSATAQKYKCLEKIREEIKSKSLTQEDFYE